MSLDGLSALIQLEGTRLEHAKGVNQSNQQVNSVVRQRGLQTASSKQSLMLQKINATYDKEVQQAEVQKLERRLARQREAEKLALSIAAIATGLSFGSALMDGLFGDAFNKDQKLGDIPQEMQVKPINGTFDTTILPQPNSTHDTVALSGYNADGSETVYMYSKNADGNIGNVRAATITEDDKKRILGDDVYNNLKAKNGGNPLTFSDIMKLDKVKDGVDGGQLAEFIMSDKSHGLARGESEAFLNSVNNSPTIHNADQIKEGLIAAGKFDNSNFGSKLAGAGAGALNILVQTAQNSIPYFQAYLAAKDRAQQTYEELLQAKTVLEAKTKKLNSIEHAIDIFAGRGA